MGHLLELPPPAQHSSEDSRPPPPPPDAAAGFARPEVLSAFNSALVFCFVTACAVLAFAPASPAARAVAAVSALVPVCADSVGEESSSSSPASLSRRGLSAAPLPVRLSAFIWSVALSRLPLESRAVGLACAAVSVSASGLTSCRGVGTETLSVSGSMACVEPTPAAGFVQRSVPASLGCPASCSVRPMSARGVSAIVARSYMIPWSLRDARRVVGGWTTEPTIQSEARGRCAGLQDEICCVDDAHRFTPDTRPRSGARDARLSGEVTAQQWAAVWQCPWILDGRRPRSQGRSSNWRPPEERGRRAMILRDRRGDEQHQSTGA